MSGRCVDAEWPGEKPTSVWHPRTTLMAGGLTATALDLLARYGYLAVAVFAFLETSLVFPFLPSEVVVPAAAALLVFDPFTLGGFAVALTVGATVGSLFAYYVIGRPGGRLLEEYGASVDIDEDDVDRARELFHEWGESSVAWGRLLPFVRSVVSTPAGGAEMDVRRFTTYTATGSFVFAAGVGWLVLVGKEHSLFAVAVSTAQQLGGQTVAVARANPLLALAAVVSLGVVGLVGWAIEKLLD